MQDVTMRLARGEDDADIRRLLAENPVPGRVTVSYEREPNYFVGCRTMGRFCQVMIGRHTPDGELVGLACRATRPLYINGAAQEVGYLSQLRIAEKYRGRWLLWRGYEQMGRLHADGRVAGYITTIVEENVRAVEALVHKARGPIPRYRPVTRLHTLALVVRRLTSLPRASVKLSRATRADLESIVAFLNRHNAARQFAPVYSVEDFDGGESSTTPGFAVEDIMLAWRDGKLAGVIGLWDQSAYKQTVVRGYQGTLARMRPLYNLGLRLAGAKALPPAGRRISHAYACFVCVEGNDSRIFDNLLRVALRLAHERGHAYLMLGLAEGDPLLPTARRHWHVAYRSLLYTVCWPGDEGWHDALDGRVPYVEIAAL